MNSEQGITSKKHLKRLKGENKGMILTLTGLPGTDTRNLCKILALQLGIKYLTKERIVEKIALEEKKEKKEIEDNALSEEFVEKLKRFILREAKQDHVIVDWELAAWVLSEADLKVFILSKEKMRAKKLTKVKKVPFIEAKKEIEEQEEEQRSNFLHLLGVNTHDLKSFDLVINADKLDADGVPAVILKYLKNARMK